MPHIHEKIDFTVEVFVVYQDRVLLRMHDKYKKWLSVGGHIELDEDPNEAAVREVREEVGLDVELYGSIPSKPDEHEKDLIPPVGLNRHRINATHEHVTLIYFARSTTDQLILSEDEKSDGCKWCTKEDLETMVLAPRIKQYALRALDELAYR